MKNKRGIIWFRNDLRIHDNEAIYDALQITDEVIPVYIFDSRVFEDYSRWGFRKCGPHRLRFIIESIHQLREELRNKGSDLIVRKGRPEDIIFDIAKEYKTNGVFCNRERTQEEEKVQDALEEKLWSIGQEMRYSRGKMLYYTQDLPFPITQTPDIFSSFRKEVEHLVPIRELLPTESMSMKPLLEDIDPGIIPSLSDYGYSDFENNQDFIAGGEIVALDSLNLFITDLIRQDLSKSKLSPYLSQGCLSPKKFYHSIDNVHVQKKKKSIEELKRNILLRDFHRLMGKKHRNNLFHHDGLAGKEPPSKANDTDTINQWISGETPNQYVNAVMKELASTGFISNFHRRIVSYYFIYELKQHWLAGASYFESILLDYDPCSNYGNWQRSAGISLDNKGEKEINFEILDTKTDYSSPYFQKWGNTSVNPSLCRK